MNIVLYKATKPQQPYYGPGYHSVQQLIKRIASVTAALYVSRDPAESINLVQQLMKLKGDVDIVASRQGARTDKISSSLKSRIKNTISILEHNDSQAKLEVLRDEFRAEKLAGTLTPEKNKEYIARANFLKKGIMSFAQNIVALNSLVRELNSYIPVSKSLDEALNLLSSVSTPEQYHEVLGTIRQEIENVYPPPSKEEIEAQPSPTIREDYFTMINRAQEMIQAKIDRSIEAGDTERAEAWTHVLNSFTQREPSPRRFGFLRQGPSETEMKRRTLGLPLPLKQRARLNREIQQAEQASEEKITQWSHPTSPISAQLPLYFKSSL